MVCSDDLERRPLGRSAVLLGLLLVAGCRETQPSGSDASLLDLWPRRDQAASQETGSLALDFVVQGCAKRTQDRCVGLVPLVLSFAAVVEEEPLSTKWDFGDGSPGQGGKLVTHTYERVGDFTVTLSVGGRGGVVSEQKEDLVQAQAAGPGAPCNASASCASGKCICQTGCSFPLDDGLCLQDCSTVACHSGSTACVDLSLPLASSSSKDPWRTRLCLPACRSDADCSRPGFSCRLAPGAGGWVRACLPPFPRSVGEPCRDGAGAADAAMCLGGVCLDIGAAGYCSASCGPGVCPEGSRCARFAGEESALFCLTQCLDGTCALDPQLDCEQPGGKDYYDFEIIGPPDPEGTRYCAAKHCTQDGECGLTGQCDLAKGGFCRPRRR